MISGENRRTFLSALLLGGGSVAAFAESYRQADAPAADGGGDALFLHIQQQLASTMESRRARGAGPTAEEVTAAATCMRICAAHARGLNLDQVARERLARVSPARREAMMTAAADLTPVRIRLRRNGVELSDGIARAVAATSAEARVAALDAVTHGRSTSICDRLADELELAAARIPAHQGPVRRVAAADQWWCNFYAAQWSMYLAMAWSFAVLQEQSLQDFIDAMWAGFVFYEGLYTAQC